MLWYFGTISIDFISRHFKSQRYITVLFIFQMFGGNLLNRQVVKTTPKSLNGSASGTHSAMVVEFVMQMVGAASNMFYFDKHLLKWVAQFHLQDHVFPNQQSRCLSLPLLSSETSHQPRYNMIQQPCLKVSHWQTLALWRLDSSVQICNHRKAHVYRDFTYTYYKTMNVHTYTQCQYCYSNIGKLPINLQNSPIFPWVVDWFVEPKATAICG